MFRKNKLVCQNVLLFGSGVYPKSWLPVGGDRELYSLKKPIFRRSFKVCLHPICQRHKFLVGKWLAKFSFQRKISLSKHVALKG